jgi:hypothetical protein
VYLLVHWRFRRRQTEVQVIERLLASKWRRRDGYRPAAKPCLAVPSTPLARWGAQRWQRPPPATPVYLSL